MAAVTKAVHGRAPGLSIIPSMSAGATDSLYFRAVGVPSYGVAGLFSKASDSFAHGLNERVSVDAIAPALAHWDSLRRDLSKSAIPTRAIAEIGRAACRERMCQ